MYKIREGKTFRKQVKKLIRSGNFDFNNFQHVINRLAKGEKLETKYKDHALAGDLAAFRECHLRSDLLLIYEINGSELILYLFAIGTHSNLFN